MAKKSSKTPLIAGGIAGGCLLLCICGGVISLFVFSGDGGGGGGGETATAISTMNLLMEGGSSEWDAGVKPLMVDGFDSNNSSLIDTAGEVGLIDCATWKALDSGVKEKWEYGLRTIYGFHADYSWVGEAIGFSETVRAEADTSLASCLGEDPSFEGGAAPAAVVAPATGGGGVAASIKAFPDGGSSEWDEKVKGVVLSNYDTDKSGAVNTAAELGGISCDVWKAMDDGVKAKYGFGIRTIYGFAADYSWIGYAVGIDESMRVPADAVLAGCGCEA